MKITTKWGFSTSIRNWQTLDKIFDLLEGKISTKKIGLRNYLVYEDGAITDEILELEKQLTKKWYSYKSYTHPELNFRGKPCSEDEFLKLKEQYEKEEERYKKQELERQKKQAIKENSDRGVYGIYCNDELIYIGKTNVSFKTRFSQHLEAINSKSTAQFLYKYIVQQKEKNNAEITMKSLVNVKELKVNGKINNRDIEAMELALIDLYKPICNIQGVKQDYEFS